MMISKVSMTECPMNVMVLPVGYGADSDAGQHGRRMSIRLREYIYASASTLDI